MSLILLDNTFSSGTFPGTGGRLNSSGSRTCSGKGTLTFTASGTPTPQYNVSPSPCLHLTFPDANGQTATIVGTQAPAVGLGYKVTVAIKNTPGSVYLYLDNNVMVTILANSGDVIVRAYRSDVAGTSVYGHIPVAVHTSNDGSGGPLDEVLVTFTIFLRANPSGSNYLCEIWAYIPTLSPFPVCLTTQTLALSSGALSIKFFDFSRS